MFCSPRCRKAASRRRHMVLPRTWWLGDAPQLSERPARDGGLTRAELGEQLIWISEHEDDGQPKTGRRFYYLALSHGVITVDMSATDAGKKSRNNAYKRVTDILGILRMNGDLDWDAVLDLTRELVEWQVYENPR
jgi:hypothetical protein